MPHRMLIAESVAIVLVSCTIAAGAELTEPASDFSLDPAAASLPIRLELPEPTLNPEPQYDAALELAQTIGDFGPDEGDWEFTLTGNGISDKDFDSNVFGFAASVGYFFTSNLEVSIRQSLNFLSNDATDDALSASTRGAVDYHFDLGQWWPFVGGSFGGVYGDGVDDAFTGGVEGGVKWYVKPETFIFGMIEWLWFFDDGSDFDDNFDDGQFVYSLGVGFNF
jgi:hypothetical protein